MARPRELNQFIGNIAKTKGFSRERARIHKDFNYSGDLIQRNVICPPPEKYQENHQLVYFKTGSQWFTTCILDFKESLRGKNDQND